MDAYNNIKSSKVQNAPATAPTTASSGPICNPFGMFPTGLSGYVQDKYYPGDDTRCVWDGSNKTITEACQGRAHFTDDYKDKSVMENWQKLCHAGANVNSVTDFQSLTPDQQKAYFLAKLSGI